MYAEHSDKQASIYIYRLRGLDCTSQTERWHSVEAEVNLMKLPYVIVLTAIMSDTFS